MESIECRTMEHVRSLLKRVDRESKRTKSKLDAFPDLATRLLTEFEYDWSQERLDQELAPWFLKSAPLPEQVSLHNPFGQPPITIYNDGAFVVDLYLWVAADTSVHSHGFRRIGRNPEVEVDDEG